MPARIRILLTISDFSGGGAEREMSILAHHLSRERYEPHLCLWRSRYAYRPPPDVPVHMLRKTRPWHAPSLIRSLRRLIEELRPRVVFSQLHYVNLLTGSALAGMTRPPRWVCRQVNDPRREMPWPFVVWARRVLPRADWVLGCSAGVSGAMIDYLRLDPGRVRTMRNAVDVERIDRLARKPLTVPKRPGTFTVVHAGRFSRQKNQRMLLDAFAHLRGRPAELWMLGEGKLGARLKAHARRVGIQNQVRWLGFIDNPFPIFSAADVFVLSSDHEGLPNAVIEAMLCGTPVVSTRCPYGPDELIDEDRTGLLVPVGDPAALGAALVRLSQDPGAVRRLGNEARRRSAERFAAEVVCAAYEDLFSGLDGAA